MTAFATGSQDALARSLALGQKIMTAANNVSAHNVALISLATRQAMGGTELTIGRQTSDPSAWNTSDVKMFMKDVGTSG